MSLPDRACARAYTKAGKRWRNGGREGREEGGKTYLEELFITIHRVLQTGQGHGHVVPGDGASSLGVQEEAGAVGGNLFLWTGREGVRMEEIVSFDLMDLFDLSGSSKCPKKQTAIILFPRKTE